MIAGSPYARVCFAPYSLKNKREKTPKRERNGPKMSKEGLGQRVAIKVGVGLATQKAYRWPYLVHPSHGGVANSGIKDLDLYLEKMNTTTTFI